MRFRYYLDPATGEPHIYSHNVTENEVEAVLERPLEDRAAGEGSRIAVGQTDAGRYLRVIYVPDPEPESVVCRHRLRSRSEGAKGIATTP